MAGVKRPRSSDATAIPRSTQIQPSTATDTTVSPLLTQFAFFRSELDAHHDRRERIVKVSRDITALSKKM